MKSYLPLITTKRSYRRLPLELMVWSCALLILALTDVHATLPVLCPIDAFGYAWCPGCGLGHAIGLLMHGQLGLSWQAHPLAAPALLILLHRIIILSRLFINQSLNQ